MPVAILTTNTFDAASVDPSTVTLTNAIGRIKGKSGNVGSLTDVDDGRDLEFVVHILTEQLALTEDDVEAVLRGSTFDGRPIQGSDSVSVVP